MFYIVDDDGEFTEEFILNIKDEIFELRVDDYLVKVPENARKITGWGFDFLGVVLRLI